MNPLYLILTALGLILFFGSFAFTVSAIRKDVHKTAATNGADITARLQRLEVKSGAFAQQIADLEVLSGKNKDQIASLRSKVNGMGSHSSAQDTPNDLAEYLRRMAQAAPELVDPPKPTPPLPYRG